MSAQRAGGKVCAAKSLAAKKLNAQKPPKKSYAKKSAEISARILSDKAGVSALGTGVYYHPVSQKNSATIPAELTIALVCVPPGCKTGWHHHLVPTAGYVIAGELVVEYENGEVRSVRAGETMVEAQDIVHEGRNLGQEDAVVVVFHAGSPGVKNTVAAKKPPNKNNQPAKIKTKK